MAGVHLERASLKEASLRYANLSNVHAEKANLSGADFRGATLRQGDFRQTICLNNTRFPHANLREADFTRARMTEAELSQADLTQACFDGADLTFASLNDAILDETSLLGTNLARARVFGAFIRRVKTNDRTRQQGLFVDVHVVWERQPGKMIDFIEADDIHVAQFHDLVDEQGSIGKLLTSTTRQVVLILGRFLPRRKQVLDRLADALRSRGKIAVIYDFPSPDNREISDTVRFIAAMSQFIVVDLTKASSVPLELQVTVPDLMVPVLPIIQSREPVFAMFSDLQRRYSWIQPTVSYKDAKQLVKYVDEAIIDRAELAAEQLRKRGAATIGPPINVSRVGRKRKAKEKE